MLTNANSPWKNALHDPSRAREPKPRQTGVTMVIDKGLGLTDYRDLLANSAPYIDFIKLGFGTSALYPMEILNEKIGLAKEHDIQIFPGGTFFEVASMKGELESYLDTVKELGFNAIEISDGTIEISRAYRNDCIRRALDRRLSVLTEYGKKISGSKMDIQQLNETLRMDIEAGAAYVIVEGREAGENVGIYDRHGNADRHFIRKVMESTGDLYKKLIWEAPKKTQQVQMLKLFHSHANIGNIAPEDIYSLESLRRGLRSDTFSFGL